MRALHLVVASLLVTGCGGELRSEPPNDSFAAPPETLPLEVELDDGTTFRGQHMIVSLADGSDGFAQITVAAMDGDGAPGWGAIAVAPVDDLDDGVLAFEMRKLPLSDGIANVSRHHADESFVAAESGVLEVYLGHDGEVDGTATATPSEVSATFQGPFSVECWVAPEALGEAPNGTGDPGGKVRIQDEDFESEFCRRFTSWR